MTSHTEIPMYFHTYYTPPAGTYPTTKTEWQKEMAEMLCSYLRGEPVYISFNDSKRTGSIALVKFDNIQQMLGGRVGYGYYAKTSVHVVEDESNVDASHFAHVYPTGRARWTGRSNSVNVWGSEVKWLKGYTGPTVWAYGKPTKPAVIPKDRLGRDITVGDFIAYILYQFDGSGAAGIYFGKVTKISGDGEVYAKNIKLNSSDRQAEKKIKESKLVTIMSDDLMKQLMLAKLSIV